MHGPDTQNPRGTRLDDATTRQIIVGIMLAMFLSALEQTIVAPALPTIGRVFGDFENLSWVVTAYLLSATAVTPLFGKLSDIYGRRRMMLIAVIIFIVGSIACAMAPTIWALILARALQGIGGGGILPLAQTVIADLLSPRERPIFQSYSSVMFMSAGILGPVIGGFLTDYVHWSLIFWINLPLGLAGLALSDRALKRLPRNDRPHSLDFLGAGLMVGAAVALLLALAWGGVRYPWMSASILGLLGVSAVLWALFAWRLLRAPEPFIPLTMLRDRVVRAVIVAGFFSIGTVVGLSIFVPLYLQLVLGFSASVSSLALIAFLCGSTLGSLGAGRLLSRLTRYKRVPVIGLAVAIAGLLLCAIRPAGLSLLEISLLLGVVGVGLGTMYPITTVVMQNIVPLHQLGTATGTLNFFRQLGGAIIVAGFGAIVLSGAETVGQAMTLDRHGSAAAVLAGDFVVVFRWVFIAAAACLAAALAAVLMIDERPILGRESRVPIAPEPPAAP